MSLSWCSLRLVLFTAFFVPFPKSVDAVSEPKIQFSDALTFASAERWPQKIPWSQHGIEADFNRKVSTRVERLFFGTETCSFSKRVPILAISSTCPCFIQYTISSPLTATWDVFVVSRSSFLQWKRIQYTGDPKEIVEVYSTRNQKIIGQEPFQVPDRNANIVGNYTLIVRVNTDTGICFSDPTLPDSTSVVFEAIPTPCPVQVPDLTSNETAPRVVGGTEVESGFRWMAVILLLTVEKAMPVCGGVHISLGFVASAAHCLVQRAPEIYRVRVGTSQADKGEMLRVRRVFVHPKYETRRSNEALYDIAILELDSIPGSATIELNRNAKIPRDGDMVTTAGFGYISEGWSGLPEPNELRRVDIPVSGCGPAYKEANQRVHICAGYPDGGCDSCASDSGGPLRVISSGRETLVGLVSYGSGCARRGAPGVYTRASAVAEWALNTISDARNAKSRTRTLVIAVVSCLAALLAIALAVAVVLLLRRRRKRARSQGEGSSMPSETGISG